jgi:branched-chain amino acid transport system substrate-binding protein
VPSAKGAGLDLTYTLYNPASPDFAPAVSAASKKSADAILIVGTEGTCTNAIKTAKQLGWSKNIVAVNCSQFINDLGSQAEGVYTLQYLLTARAKPSAPVAKQDQIQLYVDQMRAGGAEDKIDSYATYGFASIMTIAEVLKGVSGDVTAATAKPVVATYKGDVFLEGPVDCSARPMPGGSCGTTGVALRVNPDGSQEVVTGDFLDLTKV